MRHEDEIEICLLLVLIVIVMPGPEITFCLSILEAREC